MRATGARDRRTRVQGALAVVVSSAYVAVPDWVEDPRRRRLVQWVLRSGSVAAGVRSVHRAGAAEGRDPDRYLGRGFLVGAAVAVPTLLVADRGSQRLNARIVRALQRRGVARPWTWVAVGTGVVSLALDAASTQWADQHEGPGTP